MDDATIEKFVHEITYPKRSREESIAKIKEFQALPPNEKWRRISEVIAEGWRQIRQSPFRVEIERWREE